MKVSWQRYFKVLAAVVVAVWQAMYTQAQDLAPAPSNIEGRLAKVEEQNELLRKQNENLQRIVESLSSRIGAQEPPAGVPVDEVQRLVQGYLQEEKQKERKKDAGKPAAPGWYEVGSDTKMTAHWPHRLVLESANKDFRAHVGGRLQFDSYLYGEPKAFTAFSGIGPIDDAMFMRRIRIDFDGTAYESIEWDFQVDLESNQFNVNSNLTASAFDDLWVGLKDLPLIGNLRVGHVRPPLGLECYTSSRNQTFLERSSSFDAFLQDYDPGFWFFNSYLNQRLGWAFTFHRFDPESDVIAVGKGDYAGTGKIYGLPYYVNNGRGLVHLGAAYQYRSNAFNNSDQDRSVIYRARPDLRVGGLTPRFVSTGEILADHETTLGLEALAIMGPFSVQAEWFNVNVANPTYPASGGKRVASPSFGSGYVQASYFLTGENRAYDKRLGRLDRVIPHENFFLVRGENGGVLSACGAWELAVRYDMIDLNDGVIQGGYMNNYTLGLNWYLTPSLKVQWNWNMADRTVPLANIGGAASGPSGLVHSFGMRVQWEF